MAGIYSTIRQLWRRYDGPPTQASLFHYIKDEPETSVWSELDWSFLRHPIRTLREELKEPRTQASLFHYINEASRRKEPINWKEFLWDLLTSFRAPLFIPSMFADPEGLVVERAQLRTRKAEAGMLSLFVHLAIAGLAILLVRYQSQPADQKDNVVFVNNPVFLPFEGTAGRAAAAAAAERASRLHRPQGACRSKLVFRWFLLTLKIRDL